MSSHPHTYTKGLTSIGHTKPPQIEEALYKDGWARLSPLFHDEVFGPVATRAEDGYVLRGQGRFREMLVARDLGEVYEAFKPGVRLFMCCRTRCVGGVIYINMTPTTRSCMSLI